MKTLYLKDQLKIKKNSYIDQGVFYANGWCATFKIFHFFFKTLVTLFHDRFVNYINLFRIQGTGCYNIKVTSISSQKYGSLKFVKFEFRHIACFSYI